MSSHPSLSRLATRALAKHEPALPRRDADADARAIAAIEAAITREAHARRWRRMLVVSGSIAAALVCGLGVTRILRQRADTRADAKPSVVAVQSASAVAHIVRGAVVLLRDGRQISVDDGTNLAPGDRLVAPADGVASVNLSTGSHMVVENGADFGVVGLGSEQRFLLRSGSVRADVAKLSPSHRFVVGTTDAEVEVRGTSFRVSVVPSSPECGGGVTTRVSVSEGTVVVRTPAGEERVTARGEWPRGCATKEPAAARAESSAPTVLPRAALAAAPATVTPTSDIVDQNRIFGEATNAKRRGAKAEAITLYEELLRRYPSSQLAESATVERLRLLASVDGVRAGAAARDYLARYPAGYARAEANELAGRAP